MLVPFVICVRNKKRKEEQEDSVSEVASLPDDRASIADDGEGISALQDEPNENHPGDEAKCKAFTTHTRQRELHATSDDGPQPARDFTLTPQTRDLLHPNVANAGVHPGVANAGAHLNSKGSTHGDHLAPDIRKKAHQG